MLDAWPIHDDCVVSLDRIFRVFRVRETAKLGHYVEQNLGSKFISKSDFSTFTCSDARLLRAWQAEFLQLPNPALHLVLW